MCMTACVCSYEIFLILLLFLLPLFRDWQGPQLRVQNRVETALKQVSKHHFGTFPVPFFNSVQFRRSAACLGIFSLKILVCFWFPASLFFCFSRLSCFFASLLFCSCAACYNFTSYLFRSYVCGSDTFRSYLFRSCSVLSLFLSRACLYMFSLFWGGFFSQLNLYSRNWRVFEYHWILPSCRRQRRRTEKKKTYYFM